MDKRVPLSPTEQDFATRFGQMEDKWRKANARQKATIERFMDSRQQILSIIHNKSTLTAEEVSKIRKAMDI